MRATCTATQERAVDAMESVRVSLAENFETGKWDLPVLPDVAARVLSLTEDPDSDAKELAKLCVK